MLEVLLTFPDPQHLSLCPSSCGSGCVPGTCSPEQWHQDRRPVHGERCALLPVRARVHLAGRHPWGCEGGSACSPLVFLPCGHAPGHVRAASVFPMLCD